MANLTIRNIPDTILNRIRTLSTIEKRSINSELLILIEKGLNEEVSSIGKIRRMINTESQIKIWEKLIGAWEDNRDADEIINDIYENRTNGRPIEL